MEELPQERLLWLEGGVSFVEEAVAVELVLRQAQDLRAEVAIVVECLRVFVALEKAVWTGLSAPELALAE